MVNPLSILLPFIALWEHAFDSRAVATTHLTDFRNLFIAFA